MRRYLRFFSAGATLSGDEDGQQERLVDDDDEEEEDTGQEERGHGAPARGQQ